MGQGSTESYNQTRIQLVCTIHRLGGAGNLLCELFLVACSLQQEARPGCLPALHREDFYDPRLHYFFSVLPGGWEAEAGLSSPLLNSCPTQAAAAALKHSKGRTVWMFFNAQARCQGPVGFSSWYSAEPT